MGLKSMKRHADQLHQKTDGNSGPGVLMTVHGCNGDIIDNMLINKIITADWTI